MPSPVSGKVAMGAIDAPHASVMLNEVVAAIAPADGDIIVDATFGWGGYSRAFLGRAACVVYGFDRDPSAAIRGRQIESESGGRFALIEETFGSFDVSLTALGVKQIDGIAFDLGVSSMQIDDAERGFSFMRDGDLDMRMGGTREVDTPTAADVVNSTPEDELADIIWRYGDERKSRRVARAIVAQRKTKKITRTLELADIVARAVGGGASPIHPSTRTFQALRIHVNNELGQLDEGLRAAERMLAPEGRLAVVSFHSLEDRIVKNFLRERGGLAPTHSRHLPGQPNRRLPSFTMPSRSVTKPTDQEISLNPRARSARLRAAFRTENPAWPENVDNRDPRVNRGVA